MTLRLFVRALVVAVAFVLATSVAWWGVPVAAAIFGAITHRDRGGAIVSGVGAIIAWGGILLWDATRGPVGTVATTLGGVLQVNALAVTGIFLVTLMTSIIIKSLPAFTEHRAILSVLVDPAVVDPTGKRNIADLRSADYASLTRAAITTAIPGIEGRNARKALTGMLSSGAS